MSAEVEIELFAFALAYDGASPDDHHLAADIVVVDGEIVEVIAKREPRRRRKKDRQCHSRVERLLSSSK